MWVIAFRCPWRKKWRLAVNLLDIKRHAGVQSGNETPNKHLRKFGRFTRHYTDVVADVFRDYQQCRVDNGRAKVRGKHPLFVYVPEGIKLLEEHAPRPAFRAACQLILDKVEGIKT